jgi:hypothetical protein
MVMGCQGMVEDGGRMGGALQQPAVGLQEGVSSEEQLLTVGTFCQTVDDGTGLAPVEVARQRNCVLPQGHATSTAMTVVSC